MVRFKLPSVALSLLVPGTNFSRTPSPTMTRVGKQEDCQSPNFEKGYLGGMPLELGESVKWKEPTTT